MLSGSFTHEDFGGHKGVLNPGDLQVRSLTHDKFMVWIIVILPPPFFSVLVLLCFVFGHESVITFLHQDLCSWYSYSYIAIQL